MLVDMEPERTAEMTLIARNEAIRALHDVLTWSLGEDRWPSVSQALDAMDSAVDAADPVALLSATEALDRVGPTRITLIGANACPAPEQVREHATRLVHRLDRPSRATGKATPGSPKRGGCDVGGG